MSLRLACLLIASGMWALLLHMILLASSAPVERHLRVHAAVAPMRVVLISDLHVATPGNSPDRFRHTIARIEALHPDLILIAGDFLANDQPLARRPSLPAGLARLSLLDAPLGVIGVSGNHDMPFAFVRRAIMRHGVTMLFNETARRGDLAILGVGDPVTRQDFEAVTEMQWRYFGGLPIGLAHSPDAVPRFDPAVRLILTGHTHCGQIALPWIGPLATSLRVDRRYACGLVRDGDRLTVVTAGLGTSNLPFRLGVPPDFWVIDFGR